MFTSWASATEELSMQTQKNSNIAAGLDIPYYLAAVAPTILFVTVLTLNGFSGVTTAFAFHSLAVALGVFWLVLCLAIQYGVTLVGILRYGSPREHDRRNLTVLREHGWDNDKRLVLCYVSQGIQQEVLAHSVKAAIEVAKRLNVTYEIEIVVDTVPLTDPFFGLEGCQIVNVPRSFKTPHGSCFKARSLCYAASTRAERIGSLESAWVLHCDEDTVITDTSIAGIAEFLRHPRSSHICGAGEIKYNAQIFGLQNIFSIIDCHRTGEDLGRFRLQFLSKQAAITGVHGSFFVVPAKLESDIQFDFGPRGSITEDIYFAFRLRELAVPYRWIHGHVREQSPQDLRNFLNQRSRWIHGLLNVCGDTRFSLLNRLVLFGYLAILRTTIVSVFALTILLCAIPCSPAVHVLWQLSMMVVGTNVLVGLIRNIQNEKTMSPVLQAITVAVGISLVPVICLLETVAMVIGLLFRRDQFFVTTKTCRSWSYQGKS